MPAAAAKVVRLGGERAELEVSKEIAERAGLRAGEELFAFAPGANFLLLAREPSKRGFFVGNLETLSLAEVFGFVCSAIRSGVLVLQSAGARRRIGFHEGQVVFASSTEPSERLGPVLWRNGMIGLEKLQQVEHKAQTGAALGKLLIESGLLTAAQLYKGVQLQVRDIVLGAFLETQGEFAFIEGEGQSIERIRVPERTRDLALEGMSRSEQIEQLRSAFELAAVPRLGAGCEAPADLEEGAVFARIDGARSVREIVRSSRIGELAGLLALTRLVESGRVLPVPKGTPPHRPASGPSHRSESPLQLYRMAIRRICEELRAAGQEGRLFSFFATPEGREGIFQGVHLTEEGDLDVDALMANAQRLHKGAIARAKALEALDGFVAFALFDARNVLEHDEAVALSREVTRMLRGK